MEQGVLAVPLPQGKVTQRGGWPPLIGLGLIVLLGGAVRLFELDRQTIAFDEIYVPGIDLPREFMPEGVPRFTLWQVVKGCIGWEEHPPFYYVMMLAWTKLFGTGLFAMRLPSVLFGVGGIVLVYLLGRREWGQMTGLVAAGMLALNGHQVFWSQQAKGCTLACFLGIISTLSLLTTSQENPRPRRALFLYCTSTLVGLVTDYYYWPIFAVQVLWVAGKNRNLLTVPKLLRWQLFLFLVASPLCAAAVHQSEVQTKYFRGGENALPYLGQFLEFGFLFEPVPFDMSIEPARESILSPLGTAAALLLAFFGLLLLVVGLASRSTAEEEAPTLPEPPIWLLVSAALLAVGTILAFAWYSSTVGEPRTKAVTATALIPISVLILDRLLRRYWRRLQEGVLQGTMAWLGTVSLSGLLAVVPILMMFAVASVIPSFRSRWALLYTPFLLVTTAHGLEVLVYRNLRWLAFAAVLAAAHVLSVYHFAQRPNSPWDYKALAEQLRPRIQSSDLIFFYKYSKAPPLLYYLKPDCDHIVGANYSDALARHPADRVWVLTWDGPYYPGPYAMAGSMIAALQGYSPAEQIQARGARAVLYQRRRMPAQDLGEAQ
jgi:4-amino-4-deoxy-L-arabinose transferase-like glycosyltransferase